MSLLKDDQNRTWPSDAGPLKLTSKCNFKQHIENDSDSEISSCSWHATEIKHRNGTISAEPFLHNFHEWIRSRMIARRLLKESESLI